ncbi:MAG: hypothetical protein JKY51_08240, partial [Opitutaceae bacterium]|nr:hypothetical protein [Opitutaceae bacterium]
MNKTHTIGGLEITPQKCIKINEPLLSSHEIPEGPLVNISKNGDEKYTVNIIAYIADNFEKIPDNPLPKSCFYIDEKKKIVFEYSGISLVKSRIKNEMICRKFCIDYYSKPKEDKKYNLYHIKIDYKVLMKTNKFVEAIIVH